MAKPTMHPPDPPPKGAPFAFSNNAREAGLIGVCWFMLWASLPALVILATLRGCRGDYATRADLEELGRAQRLDASKLADIAFAYQCPECQFVTLTTWHAGDNRCPQCRCLRKFVGVTVLDEHELRGMERPRIARASQ